MKHETLLDGLHFGSAAKSEVIAPTLLRYDLGPDLLELFYDDLRQPNWIDQLKVRADLPTRSGVALVPQGRHRKCIIVVVDAACLMPGFPRLDPSKVEQAAMVIRRDIEGETQAWLKDRHDKPMGWFRVNESALTANSTYDPNAALRRKRLTTNNRVLMHKPVLTGDADGVTETVDTLHPIPPDIAKKIGRTLYYGVLKTTSQAIQPQSAPPPPFDLDDVAQRVPNLLQAKRSESALPPDRDDNETITRTELRAAKSLIVNGAETNQLAALRSALTWFASETGLFTGEDYAQPLVTELKSIILFDSTVSSNMYGWMETAQKRLVEGSVADDTIIPPTFWPTISVAQFASIQHAAYEAMLGRWNVLAPTVSRFAPIGDRYHVRAMLRINDRPGCPPRMLWSPLSSSYTIRPWYESDGGPVTQVDLPDITPETMAEMSPDVAIKVPPAIQRIMDKLNLDDLLNGEVKTGAPISFGMICGFSIPIITLCAFIVLSIFLSLLNIIFYWLPFIKICIPYPKVKP